MKPATIETALLVQVPPFVNEGDRIKVTPSDAARRAGVSSFSLDQKVSIF